MRAQTGNVNQADEKLNNSPKAKYSTLISFTVGIRVRGVAMPPP